MEKNYTYILRCADSTLYTGWTNDIEKRLAAHNAGTASKCTRSRTPVTLAHLEVFPTREEAMRREWEIKQLKKSAKERLLDTYSPEQQVRRRLFELQDEKYRVFTIKLNPGTEPDRVIGVRTPAVRALAKELSGTPLAQDFMASLPHGYMDENSLHAALIMTIKDYDAAMEETERFLPYIDDWATCDMLAPKVFKKRPEETLWHVRRWLGSGETYTVRFGIVELMRDYLDGNFREEFLKLAADACCGEYYINMAVAWYFSVALIKQYDAAVQYMEDGMMDKWVHNKSIRKALESYRMPPERKEYLRGLRK